VLVFAMMPGASLGERIMPVGFLFMVLILMTYVMAQKPHPCHSQAGFRDVDT
jgi:hypothetical protein